MADKGEMTTKRKLTYPSCGRSAGTASDDAKTVDYLGTAWCDRCARIGKNGSFVYVRQPSPGRMIEDDDIDLIKIWSDCFEMRPKRRMRVSDAKLEIQRAWKLWEGDKRSVMSMFLFFGWLQRNRPLFLTFRSKGDPWQDVHSWLLEYERGQSAGQFYSLRHLVRPPLAGSP